MPQTQSAQIVFAQDEQSNMSPKIQVLLQAYHAYLFAQQSLNNVSNIDIPNLADILETTGSKEQIQDALAISENTLSQALNKCSEQEIERINIDTKIKQKLKLLKREKELNKSILKNITQELGR